MPNSANATSVRQGRLGRQVLVILVASLVLAVMSGWVLWGAFADEATSQMRASSRDVIVSSEAAQSPRISSASID